MRQFFKEMFCNHYWRPMPAICQETVSLGMCKALCTQCHTIRNINVIDLSHENYAYWEKIVKQLGR